MPDLSTIELQAIRRMLPKDSRFVLLVLAPDGATYTGDLSREVVVPLLRAAADSFERGLSVRVVMEPHGSN